MEDSYDCTGVDDMEAVGEAVVKFRLTGCESPLEWTSLLLLDLLTMDNVLLREMPLRQ